MRLSAIPIVIVAMLTMSAQDSYFPNGALSDYDRVDAGRARWYSCQLRALDEPSLLAEAKNPSTQSYRFLWLRTFHHPVAVRLDIMLDGTSKLTVKIASGAGGYEPGKLIKNTSRSVTREETDKFLEEVKEVGFWELPSYEKTSGCDGAQWIIEGAKDGKYHVVDRWTPSTGPVHSLGIGLALTVAQLKIPNDELY
jgi:hypothetical protein